MAAWSLCPCASAWFRAPASGDGESGKGCCSLSNVGRSQITAAREGGVHKWESKNLNPPGHLRRRDLTSLAAGNQTSPVLSNFVPHHQHRTSRLESTAAREEVPSKHDISSESSQGKLENPRRVGFTRYAARTGNVLPIAATSEAASMTLPEGATPQDAEYMRMAVELARKAVGHTSPNPMVGCVIVKDGQIVGRGFHPKAGEPHAEVFALREAGKNAEGATAYVSLEPCNHTGRTPPCSQALVRARVSRVVVGTVDPNPLVGGKGVETLRKAGIQVVVGVEQALCQATAETFFHRIVTRKPFLTLRYTMSLDGAVLPSQENRASEAGSHYSLLLQETDAVIVTDTCVHNDNPTLLSFEAGAKQPLRVVIARSLELPLSSYVFDTSVAPTLVITDADSIVEDVQNGSKHGGQSMESILRSRGVDVVAMNGMNLDAVLDLLYQKELNSALLDSAVSDVEQLLGPLALSKQGPQKVVVVFSPVLAGSKRDGSRLQLEDDELKLERVVTKVCGGAVVVEGYVSKLPG